MILRLLLKQRFGKAHRLIEVAGGGGQDQRALEQKGIFGIGLQRRAVEAGRALGILLDIGGARGEIRSGEAGRIIVFGVVTAAAGAAKSNDAARIAGRGRAACVAKFVSCQIPRSGHGIPLAPPRGNGG